MIVDNCLFFVWKPKICIWGAYLFFGVKKGSYLGNIVKRIYNCYCRGAQSTYLMYHRYYKREFLSYNEFLERRFNLSSQEIDKLGSVFLCCKSIQSQYDLTQLLEDERLNDIFLRFLGGEINED